MIRSVIAAIKNSYKPLCKQESDNLWCGGKLLISIKCAMNSSRIELLWFVWDQSRTKYYLRTNFQDGIVVYWIPFVCFSIEPTASRFNIYKCIVYISVLLLVFHMKPCIKYVDKKSPAKNLQISSCSIATLSHVCNYKVQFCAFKGDAQNLAPSSSQRLTGM
jgi:hypothetical protein